MSWNLAIERAINELAFIRIESVDAKLEDNPTYQGYSAEYQQVFDSLNDRLPGEMEALTRLEESVVNVRTVENEVFYKAGLDDGVRLALQFLGYRRD